MKTEKDLNVKLDTIIKVRLTAKEMENKSASMNLEYITVKPRFI
jgi:hypothetical protein